MLTLFRDLETKSTLDLRNTGAWRYSTHPTTDVWCCAYAVDDGPVQIWTPGQAVPDVFVEAATNLDFLIVAHNDQFERLIEQHVLAPRYGWPIVPIERHRCTMAAALAMALPAGLEKVAQALGLEQRKSDSTLMKRMARPRRPRQGEDPNGVYWFDDPERLELLRAYCKQDIETERELYQRLRPLVPAEQELWELDARINDRGFYTDGPLIDAALRIVETLRAGIDEELAAITDGAVTSINQTGKLIAWLNSAGYTISDVQKNTIRNALRRKAISPEARRVLELRHDGAHASTAKLEAFQARRNDDGRIRGEFRYHGASTGRWSGLGCQPQNLKRPESSDINAAIGAVMAGTATKLSVVGDISRALVCAAPGCRFIAGDFSGIESRVLAWVSNQRSKLALWETFDRTHDANDEPYIAIGRKLGVPEEQARVAGKTADLAFGYMGGTGAWRTMAKLYLPDDASTDAEIRQRQQAWRIAHPETVRFWHALNRAAVIATREPGNVVDVRRVSFCHDGKFLFLKLPSGRSLAYPFASLMTTNRGELAVTYQDSQAGKWTPCRFGQGSYGGIFCENVVSAIARDLLAAAIQRLELAGYPVVLHVHDEIVSEALDGFGSTDEFEQIITTLPDWAEGLPVTAKVRNGPRFAKTNGAPKAEPRFTRVGKPALVEETQPIEPKLVPTEPETPKANGHARHSSDGDVHGDSGPAQGKTLKRWVYESLDRKPYLRVNKLVLADGTRRFYQDHWNGKAWVHGVKGTYAERKILYRLPDLRDALQNNPDTEVHIAEGEKDCETLREQGYVAITNPGGALSWTDDLTAWLRALGVRRAALHEDNDDKGRLRTARLTAALSEFIKLRVVRYQDVPPGEDVTWWLNEGGRTTEELRARIEAAPSFEPSTALRSKRASQYQKRAVDWLWEYRIAKGALNILAGLPERGKGVMWADITARITTGGKWPAGEGKAPIGNVIVFTAEDDIERTVVPRLEAAGADLSRVEIVEMARNPDGSERMFNLVTDLRLLKAKIEEVGDVVLIIIDPVAAYLGVGKISGGSATDVRGVLSPLTKLAEDKQAGILAVMHFNKKADITNAILRIADSLAYAAIGRSIYISVEDREQEGAYLYVKAKCNLAPANLAALRYTINSKRIGFDEELNKPIEPPYLIWDDRPVRINALEAMEAAAEGSRSNALQDAKDFITAQLAQGPITAEDIFADAKALGIAKRTLDRAKRELNIKVGKAQGKMHGPWCWFLPETTGN
jgi:DNA polymerase